MTGANENADPSMNLDKKKSSRDREGLGYYRAGRFTVDYVDEVNGPGAAEMLDFVHQA